MAKVPKRTDGFTEIDTSPLLNNPRAAGVSLAVDLLPAPCALRRSATTSPPSRSAMWHRCYAAK